MSERVRMACPSLGLVCYGENEDDARMKLVEGLELLLEHGGPKVVILTLMRMGAVHTQKQPKQDQSRVES